MTNLNRNDSIVSFKKLNILAGETGIEEMPEVKVVISPNVSMEM